MGIFHTTYCAEYFNNGLLGANFRNVFVLVKKFNRYQTFYRLQAKLGFILAIRQEMVPTFELLVSYDVANE